VISSLSTFGGWIAELEALAEESGLELNIDQERAVADYAAGKAPIDVLEDYATGH